MKLIQSSPVLSVSAVLSAALLLSACASNQDTASEFKTDPKTANTPIDQVSEPLIDREVLREESVAFDATEEFEVLPAPAPAQAQESVYHQPMAAKQKRIAMDAMHSITASAPDFRSLFYQDNGREKYASIIENNVFDTISKPVSTFSIDVDTGSYANVRRMLNQGLLPPADAVRIEEMINYFDYQQAAPAIANQPFNVHTELAYAPWDENKVLLKVGLKGYEVPADERPASNLVFLLDVSGSMNAPDKLPLLKQSLLLLTKQLSERDRVSIVVYAGASGVVLEPTPGNQQAEIELALSRLASGGSTNGEAGIHLAYRCAQEGFIEGGINRVILATDGDFNVGVSDIEKLKSLITQYRKKNIALTTLGFGTGNYNDHLMESIADVGNGNYAYIDSLKEARKVLAEELGGTLQTIAKDVKIQIEFNPEQVAEYRLLGYENRVLNREDFNNDKVDAGEIGQGHSIVAFYELSLSQHAKTMIEPLRYQSRTAFKAHSDSAQPTRSSTRAGLSKELAFIRLRYKQPGGQVSQLIEKPLLVEERYQAFTSASEDFRFAASVAQFGQLLRDSKYMQQGSFEDVLSQALSAKGYDEFGYRSEFIQLVRLAGNLQ